MNGEIDVGLLKTGNSAEFEALVRLCEKKVYNLALHYTNNEADAMDVSQEVFIRVFRFLPNFKEECAITTWVYRIAVNTAIDLTRKKKRRAEQSLTLSTDSEEEKQEELPDERYAPEETYAKRELRETLQRAITSLPEDQRKIIVLRDINDLSYAEIGETLGVNEGTVKSRLFRARDRLRGILEKEGNIPAARPSKSAKGGGKYV